MADVFDIISSRIWGYCYCIGVYMVGYLRELFNISF